MKSLFPKPWRMLFACLSVLAGVLLIWCSVSSISPEDRTYTSVSMLRTAINSFVAANGCAPTNLDELISHEPRVSTLKDGWGNPLIYQVTDSGVVSIASLGKDKKTGGSGPNADLVWRFALKDASGKWIGTNWQDGCYNWLTDPFRPIGMLDPSKSNQTGPVSGTDGKKDFGAP